MHKAHLYSAANALQRRDAAAALERYRDALTWGAEDCEVLDVGCGCGEVTRKLLLPALKSCTQLTGVDVSPAMVDFASQNHRHPHLHFRCLDIAGAERPRSLFPNGFHKIFSFYCLHWVRDQKRAMHNMFELLIPGGQVLLVFLASNPIFTLYERLAETTHWAPYMEDFEQFESPYRHCEHPEQELRAHLETAGFQVQDCECREQTFKYPSIQALRGAVRAVNPFLERIPNALHEAYLDACVAEAEAMGTVSADGTVTAQYRLLVALARKY